MLLTLILGRIPLYLYNERPCLPQILHSKSFGYDIIREMQIGLFLCDATKIPLMTSQPKVQRQKSLKRQGFLLSRYIAILLRILQALNKNTPIIKYKLIYYTFEDIQADIFPYFQGFPLLECCLKSVAPWDLLPV